MTDPIHWKQVETPNIIKFPAHIPEDGIVIKEGNKTFKIHHVVVNLDDTFMVNGKEYSRYSAFEKGQMLSLPLWGSCQIRDFEIFKVPGNWIRLAKMPIIQKMRELTPEDVIAYKTNNGEYRILEVGNTIQEGDEAYEYGQGETEWTTVGQFISRTHPGDIVNKDTEVRRLVDTKESND
jgi:hypothetical protein